MNCSISHINITVFPTNTVITINSKYCKYHPRYLWRIPCKTLKNRKKTLLPLSQCVWCTKSLPGAILKSPLLEWKQSHVCLRIKKYQLSCKAHRIICSSTLSIIDSGEGWMNHSGMLCCCNSVTLIRSSIILLKGVDHETLQKGWTNTSSPLWSDINLYTTIQRGRAGSAEEVQEFLRRLLTRLIGDPNNARGKYTRLGIVAQR